MISKLPIMMLLLLAMEALPAAASCQVCDGNGCKNASATESGRVDCTATTTSCTISGSTCFSGGCDDVYCGPDDQTGFLSTPHESEWQLIAVRIVPAQQHPTGWQLVSVSATNLVSR